MAQVLLAGCTRKLLAFSLIMSVACWHEPDSGIDFFVLAQVSFPLFTLEVLDLLL